MTSNIQLVPKRMENIDKMNHTLYTNYISRFLLVVKVCKVQFCKGRSGPFFVRKTANRKGFHIDETVNALCARNGITSEEDAQKEGIMMRKVIKKSAELAAKVATVVESAVKNVMGVVKKATFAVIRFMTELGLTLACYLVFFVAVVSFTSLFTVLYLQVAEPYFAGHHAAYENMATMLPLTKMDFMLFIFGMFGVATAISIVKLLSIALLKYGEKHKYEWTGKIVLRVARMNLDEFQRHGNNLDIFVNKPFFNFVPGWAKAPIKYCIDALKN